MSMSQKLMKKLNKVKVLWTRQDKVTINSWDITYQE